MSDFNIEPDVIMTLPNGTELVRADDAFAEGYLEAMRLLHEQSINDYKRMKLEMAKAFEAGCVLGYDAGISGAQIIIENLAEEKASEYIDTWVLRQREETRRMA